MPGRMRDPGPLVRGRIPVDGRGTSVRGTSAPGTSGPRASSELSPADRPVVDETWSVAELRRRAAQLGVEGRSSMHKSELIDALRGR
jgi:hypothetical protein